MSSLTTVTQTTYQDAMLNKECLKIYLLKSVRGSIFTPRIMLTTYHVYFLVKILKIAEMKMQDCDSFGSFGIRRFPCYD